MNLFLLLLPMVAWSSPQSPKVVVEDIFAKASVSEVAKDMGKQNEVNAYVDFHALAKAALGRNFKAASAGDFAWFRNTLQEIISRTVYPKAPEFLQGVKISYSGVEEKGEKAVVKSTVQNKADVTEVFYELHRAKDNWRVVDVSISGVSWVESIREQVNDVLKKKKWPGLKEAMNKRLRELRAGGA